MNWYVEVLKKYAVFSGRAQRKEYWMFFLFNVIIAIVLAVVDSVAGTQGVIGLVYSFALLLPGIAVAVRRLHDTDRSGWWLLIALVPVIGGIVLLVYMVQDGQPGDNRFGPNPKLTGAMHQHDPMGAAKAA